MENKTTDMSLKMGKVQEDNGTSKDESVGASDGKEQSITNSIRNESVRTESGKPIKAPLATPEVMTDGSLDILDKVLRYKQRITDADSTNVCSQCGKTFRQRRNLRTHEKSHAGTFPFTCCDRGFRSRRDLDRHRCREDDLTKNYVCLTCNKTFATSSDLKAHERRENNLRVFSCDICGHRAATRYELTEHMRSHADSRSRLACAQCGAMYKHRSSLNRHIKQRPGKE